MNKVSRRRGVTPAGRLEGWVQAIVSDREKLARFMVIVYWVSTAVTLLGAALIVWFYLGGRP